MADTISNSNRKGKTNQSLEWLLKNLTKHCLTKLPSYRGRLPYWINIIYLPPGTLLLVFCAAFSCWLGQNPPLLRQKKKKHFSVSSVYNQLKKRKTTTKTQKTPQRMRCFFFFSLETDAWNTKKGDLGMLKATLALESDITHRSWSTGIALFLIYRSCIQCTEIKDLYSIPASTMNITKVVYDVVSAIWTEISKNFTIC